MAARMQYQYDTSPRKLQEPQTRKKAAIDKQKSKKTNLKTNVNTKKMSKAKIMLYLALCFSVLFVLGYRNAQIDESFAKLQGLKTQLYSLEKETEQLKVGIENSLNLSNIEETAREKLGMQKLDNKQKIYLNLPKRDYIEPATEKVKIEQVTWIDEILKMVKNIL